MNKKFSIFMILIFVFMTGCSSVSKKTELYSRKHSLRGNASWYGREFQGKLTASGEKYNVSNYTAAHKSLPFGTIVRVTNTNNGKSVQVKINDRGPFTKGRVIDLTPKAFDKIAQTEDGVVPVMIEIIDDSSTFRYKN